MLSALILLVAKGHAPVLVVLIIMAREIAIMALREFMAGSGSSVPVSRMGKWKTGFQLTAIIMLFLQESFLGLPLQIPGTILLVVAMFLTLWSGYLYMMSAWPKIREGI